MNPLKLNIDIETLEKEISRLENKKLSKDEKKDLDQKIEQTETLKMPLRKKFVEHVFDSLIKISTNKERIENLEKIFHNSFLCCGFSEDEINSFTLDHVWDFYLGRYKTGKGKLENSLYPTSLDHIAPYCRFQLYRRILELLVFVKDDNAIFELVKSCKIEGDVIPPAPETYCDRDFWTIERDSLTKIELRIFTRTR